MTQGDVVTDELVGPRGATTEGPRRGIVGGHAASFPEDRDDESLHFEYRLKVKPRAEVSRIGRRRV